MKICLVTDFAKTGGAATAADRIARTFFENGCKVDRISSDGCFPTRRERNLRRIKKWIC